MSGADKIIEKIIQDAEEKAAGYIRSAEERAARIIADAEQEAKINLENRLQKAYSEAENLKRESFQSMNWSQKNQACREAKSPFEGFELALETGGYAHDNRYGR